MPRRRHRAALLAVTALTVLAAAARAAEPAPSVAVRVGNHPGHGRVVFDWPRAVPYRVVREGDRLLLRFEGPPAADAASFDLAAAAARPPRNVAGIAASAEGVTIALRPGARFHHFRLGGRIVVDALDPEPAAPAAAPAHAPAHAPASPPAEAPPGAGLPSGIAEPARQMPPPRRTEPRRTEPSPAEARGLVGQRRAEAGRRGGPAAPAATATGASRTAAQIAPPASPPAAYAPAVATAESIAPPAATPGAAPAGLPPFPAPLGPTTASPAPTTPPSRPLVPGTTPAVPRPVTEPDTTPAVPPGSSSPSSSSLLMPGSASALPVPVAAPGAIPAVPPPRDQRAGGPAYPAPESDRFVIRPVTPADGGEAAAGRAILLPFGEGVGAAAFRRGAPEDPAVLVVFDAVAPAAPDLSALRGDPVFGAAEIRTTTDATVLRVPLAAPALLRPRPLPGGAWLVEALRAAPPGDGAPPARILTPEIEAGPEPRLLLRAVRPGRAVAITDPETGAPLLVATLREAGQAVAPGRRQAQFDLLPTFLGAALLARSDALVLRRAGAEEGFALTAAGGATLALGPGRGRSPLVEAAAMNRILDLPAASRDALAERLRLRHAAIAAAAPLARAPARRDAAETLLALGLPQEAQAMATLAAQEDPRAADDPRLLLVQGAAALLAGRLPEAARALEDARVPATSDEAVLWRAALAAARGEARLAAPALAATAPLLFAYPEALRTRLLPPVAEALIEGGESAAAAGLLDAAPPDAPGVALARARLAEAEGRSEEALAGYDALAAQGRDRRARAQAIRRVAELRLATGALDAAGAAAALEAALYAWRGDAAEAEARLRLAVLKRQAGDPQGAFALLRETVALHPAQAAALRPVLAEAFLAAIGEAPPLAAVALADAHPELLPPGPRGAAALLLLADRLAALDLPARAAGLLRDAATRAGSEDPAARAGIGARLAALRLGEGDAAGALAALAETGAPDLPPALSAERGIVRARALARSGEQARAEEALRALGPTGAAPLADLLAESQDWAGAATALAEHLDLVLPPPPAPLEPEQRRALTRLAALAALAGDESRLAALRAAQGGRMRGGPLAEAFALLTAGKLRGLADLPRLQRELELIRAMPSRLEALRAGGPVTR